MVIVDQYMAILRVRRFGCYSRPFWAHSCTSDHVMSPALFSVVTP